MRYKDKDGNWEEDGHFWTVYAMGMKPAKARQLAKAAEKYDHEVHGDNSFSITPHPKYPDRSDMPPIARICANVSAERFSVRTTESKKQNTF